MRSPRFVFVASITIVLALLCSSFLSQTRAPIAVTHPIVPGGGAAGLFLKVGKIKGNSVDANHREWIEARGFALGVARPVGAGRPHFQDLTINVGLDPAMPELSFSCAKGTRHPQTLFEVVRPGPKPYVSLRIELENATVVSAGHAGESADASGAISLSFEKITWTQTELDAAGNPSSVTRWWDLRTNSGG